MEVKDLLGFGRASEKLLEIVSKGIGILYEPIKIQMLANAKANEIKKIDEAISNSKNLIEYSNGEIVCQKAPDSLIQRSNVVFECQKVREQKNLEEIIVNAYENLLGEELKNDKEIDEEWVYKFFSLAKGVNSNVLKIIWGKILSEEILEPGKCSIRTLEVLKNLNREEAELFKVISNYIIEHKNDAFIIADESLLSKYDITYGTILKLDEALLINSNSAQYKFNLKTAYNNEEILMYNGYNITIKAKKNKDIRPIYNELKVFPITKAGVDIFHIISPQASMSYLEDLIKKMEIQELDTIINKN